MFPPRRPSHLHVYVMLAINDGRLWLVLVWHLIFSCISLCLCLWPLHPMRLDSHLERQTHVLEELLLMILLPPPPPHPLHHHEMMFFFLVFIFLLADQGCIQTEHWLLRRISSWQNWIKRRSPVFQIHSRVLETRVREVLVLGDALQLQLRGWSMLDHYARNTDQEICVIPGNRLTSQPTNSRQTGL